MYSNVVARVYCMVHSCVLMLSRVCTALFVVNGGRYLGSVQELVMKQLYQQKAPNKVSPSVFDI